MPKLYFEDFTPGQVAEYGPRLITREEVIAFAAEFDPQPMHLDEDAGARSMLGGLAASGWHSCALVMRMMCDGFLLETASMGTNAIDEVRWLAPVRPGDQLTLRVTVLETRVSSSRPSMGIIRALFEMFNDHAICVMAMRAPLLIGLRNPKS